MLVRFNRWAAPMFDDARMLVRWLFLRGLALLVLVALISLHGQLPGLVGPDGILPIIEGLQTAGVESALDGYFVHPTLAWWMGSFQGLLILSWIGIALCVLLFFDVFPRLTLFLLWIIYLSLFVAGQQFTSYQWDLLIVETLFCSIFYAPGNLWPGGSRAKPSRSSVFLMRVILFKLMFLGGAAKLISGDETWWGLTALNYHFETQPLPTVVAWYVDKLPGLILKVGVLFTFLVELVVPFFVFAKRTYRVIAVGLIAGFQVIVFLTGNYGVFNLHSILLCLPVLGDRDLWWLKNYAGAILPSSEQFDQTGTVRFLRIEIVLIGLLLLLNLFVLASSFGINLARGPLASAWQSIQHFRTVNSYGLFASMTTVRREVVIQGSRDGRNWKSYHFPYKPGPTDRRSGFVSPHMPRLDWQMWFAALKPANRVRWLPHFLKRVLEGSDPVLDLLEKNPFGDSPPRYVRAVIYRYEFTNWGSDRWWERSNKRLYFPAVTLRNGQLKRASASVTSQ